MFYNNNKKIYEFIAKDARFVRLSWEEDNEPSQSMCFP